MLVDRGGRGLVPRSVVSARSGMPFGASAGTFAWVSAGTADGSVVRGTADRSSERRCEGMQRLPRVDPRRRLEVFTVGALF